MQPQKTGVMKTNTMSYQSLTLEQRNDNRIKANRGSFISFWCKAEQH